MEFITKFLIKKTSKKVGSDEFGNCYYQHKKNNKRFVIYNGIAESSKVPAKWHGWLHYTNDDVPSNDGTKKYSWQKIHIPNLTGTLNAHDPKKRESSQTSTNYQSWKPN